MFLRSGSTGFFGLMTFGAVEAFGLFPFFFLAPFLPLAG
jgi:hypothetical protein